MIIRVPSSRHWSLLLGLTSVVSMTACESVPLFNEGLSQGQRSEDEDELGKGKDNLNLGDGGAGGGAPIDEMLCDADAGRCEEGELPPPDPACGDGRINVEGETCDDGNGDSGDGCTANCELEADYACPTPGKSCVSTVVCGDSKVTGAETCDDGNAAAGDGCDTNCGVEEGYSCLTPGLRCTATACGDSLVAGAEECDFGSDQPGCTSCQIDDGYDCDGTSCTQTVCGNGEVERGEQCEDGNERPFDGCYQCKFEVECQGGVCDSVCGDGQRYDGEACDDGNARDGDGCSSTCAVEEGFSCEDIVGTPPPSIELPVIFRDFIGRSNSLRDPASCYNPREGEVATVDKPLPCYHINFNNLSGTRLQDVVEETLGSDGTPDMLCPAGDCGGNPGVTSGNFTVNSDFEDWYDDANVESLPVYDKLTLTQQSGSTYNFDPGSFYPLDGRGWVASGDEQSVCTGHNLSFTTETRFFFEYQGGERFDFDGDDDLWVFVNGRLAVDLAGLHGPRKGWFELDSDTDDTGPDTADGSASFDNDVQDNVEQVDLGLTVGGVYEVALFHAERNQCGTNFELTLKDFNKPKSRCESFCGDGIVASDELCDDGPDGNDGSYGKCGADCRSRGPYCGDGQPQEGELCDDGVNLSTYGAGCAPGCVVPPSCGDGLVQSDFEDCDDGVNDGGYAECASGCVLGPYCGDGKTDEAEGEACDDGNRTNGDGCNVNCVAEINVVK